MVQVYIDRECGSEVCSDAYPCSAPFENADFELVAFEAKSRMVLKGNEDFGISCNPDEDAGEGAEGEGGDGTKEKINDIIDSFHLQALPADAKFFKSYFASYSKNILLPSVPEAEQAAFKTALSGLFQEIVKKFGDGELYQAEKAAESDDALRCMPIFAYWSGEEEAPRFIFFKHGLKTEKY